MRLLIDNNLPPSLVDALEDWDVVHAQQLGLQAAPDRVLFDLAAKEHRALVSMDGDFGTLLALLGAQAPSVVFIRRPDLPTAILLAPVLVKELPRFREIMVHGALLVFEQNRIRCRTLPLSGRGSTNE
jgi:predicted nuclease of predicted toxin-antitoxin system